MRFARRGGGGCSIRGRGGSVREPGLRAGLVDVDVAVLFAASPNSNDWFLIGSIVPNGPCMGFSVR